MGGERCDLRDLRPALYRGGHVADLVSEGYYALLDASLQRHGVCARGDVLEAFVYDCLGENGSGGGAVAGDVVRLAGGFLEKLGAHVLKRVFEFDFLGDGDAVAADLRGAELLVENDVAATRSEGNAYGACHLVDAALHRCAGVFTECELLGHCLSSL